MFSFVIGSLHVNADTERSKGFDLKHGPIEQWYSAMAQKAEHMMQSNQLQNGAIIASPSRHEPDYYYHWTRDAALTMDAMLLPVRNGSSPKVTAEYAARAIKYLDFSLQTQRQESLSGSVESLRNLGEPKYYVDGRPFDGPWGRPQADGPALRALTVLRLLELAKENRDFAQGLGSSGVTLAQEVVRRDLQYVLLRWRDASFDLWEEVQGSHFYTRLAQYQALIAGAKYFTEKKDQNIAAKFQREVAAVKADLERFWSEDRGYILTTLDRSGGLDYKTSNLDSSVILAALHAAEVQENKLDIYGPLDDRILATAQELKTAFNRIYPVNNIRQSKGSSVFLEPGIGRYPEDRYDGVGSSEGHPWFLATMALSELHYRVAQQLDAKGSLVITQRNYAFFRDVSPSLFSPGQKTRTVSKKDSQWQALITDLIRAGDGYAERVRFHSGDDGALSEQFNRYSGFMRGARDLTWSYASVATAWHARKKALN